MIEGEKKKKKKKNCYLKYFGCSCKSEWKERNEKIDKYFHLARELKGDSDTKL